MLLPPNNPNKKLKKTKKLQLRQHQKNQNFVSLYRMANNTNTLEAVKKLIKKNLYHEGIYIYIIFFC